MEPTCKLCRSRHFEQNSKLQELKPPKKEMEYLDSKCKKRSKYALSLFPRHWCNVPGQTKTQCDRRLGRYSGPEEGRKEFGGSEMKAMIELFT